MYDRLPLKGACRGSRDLLKFWEITKTVQDRDIFATGD